MEWCWQEASFTVAQTSSCDVMQEIIVTVAMLQCVCQHFWWTKVLTNTEMYRKMSGIPTKQLRCMTGSVSHHIAISVSSSPPLRSELSIEFLELDLIRWYNWYQILTGRSYRKSWDEAILTPFPSLNAMVQGAALVGQASHLSWMWRGRLWPRDGE